MTTSTRTIAVECQINVTLLSTHNKYDGKLDFKVLDQAGRKLIVSISLMDEIVTIKNHSLQIDENLYLELQKTLDNSYMLAQSDSNKISSVFWQMREAADKVLATIKYHLKHYSIPETSGSYKYLKWGDSANNLNTLQGIHHGHLTFIMDDYSHRRIDEEWQGFVQRSLDSNIAPLLAMRHLHRAKIESRPHYKWIDATIAAELAIKEILIRRRPEVAEILLELPSPPASKLYGKLSAHYLGARSPYVNKLQEGQNIRNELVHRPAIKTIDEQKANDYVDMVSDAIFHLLGLVYPNDILIRHSAPVTTDD